VVFQNAPGAGFVRAVEPGSAAARAGLQPWDQLLAVAGATVSSPQHLEELAHGRRGQPTDILVLRQGQRLPLSWTPAEGALGLEFWPAPAHPVIASLEKGEAAEGAGLRPQDELISLAGIGVFTAQQATQLVNGYVGKPIQAVVARCGERKSFTVTPRIDKEFKRGRIGIVFASSPMQYEVQYPGPSPWTQVVEVWDRTLKTLGALVHSRQTGVGVKDLSGPPGILAMMAIQVNTDYRLALSFLVLLNINLAVLNLLPIPVLDGGHILLALVERIRRRPLSVRLVEYTTTAFAVLLISFLAYVSFNDIKRMPRFREVFQRSTTVEPSGGQAPQTEAPQPSPAPAK
jgi:regulator of sigma E protease